MGKMVIDENVFSVEVETETGIEQRNLELISVLGEGRGAEARLVRDLHTEQLIVEKVEKAGPLTRFIYAVTFQAPFAYKRNHDAIRTAFYRRMIIQDLNALWELDLKFSDALYTRWDSETNSFVLGTEHIAGKGPIPNPVDGEYVLRLFDRELKKPSPSHIPGLVKIMRRFQSMLHQSGLIGTEWQTDPKVLPTTANFLYDGEKWNSIDLESAIPAVTSLYHLMQGFSFKRWLLFDDVNFNVLHDYISETRQVLTDDLGSTGFERLEQRIEKLEMHMTRWKQSEHRPLEYLPELLPSLVSEARDVAAKIKDKAIYKFFSDKDYRLEAFQNLHFALLYSMYRKEKAEDFVRDNFIEFRERGWVSEKEFANLEETLDSGVMMDHLNHFGAHIIIRAMNPPLIGDAVLAALTVYTGELLYLSPMLLPAALRTLYTSVCIASNMIKKGRPDALHLIALPISPIPTIGFLAYPSAMSFMYNEFSDTILRIIASKTGKAVPVFGGKDTRLELYIVKLVDGIASARTSVTHPIETAIGHLKREDGIVIPALAKRLNEYANRGVRIDEDKVRTGNMLSLSYIKNRINEFEDSPFRNAWGLVRDNYNAALYAAAGWLFAKDDPILAVYTFTLSTFLNDLFRRDNERGFPKAMRDALFFPLMTFLTPDPENIYVAKTMAENPSYTTNGALYSVIGIAIINYLSKVQKIKDDVTYAVQRIKEKDFPGRLREKIMKPLNLMYQEK